MKKKLLSLTMALSIMATMGTSVFASDDVVVETNNVTEVVLVNEINGDKIKVINQVENIADEKIQDIVNTINIVPLDDVDSTLGVIHSITFEEPLLKQNYGTFSYSQTEHYRVKIEGEFINDASSSLASNYTIGTDRDTCLDATFVIVVEWGETTSNGVNYKTIYDVCGTTTPGTQKITGSEIFVENSDRGTINVASSGANVISVFPTTQQIQTIGKLPNKSYVLYLVSFDNSNPLYNKGIALVEI